MLKFVLAATMALSLAVPSGAEAASKGKKKTVRASSPAVTMPARSARMPGPSWAGPNDCYTDEGYGRYAICGGGQDY